MGEPLQNYDNVLSAVRFMHDDHGLKVPMARITISTAGLLPEIERLGGEPLFPNLSISLTGATNATRNVMMPINRKYPIEAVMDAVRRLPPRRQKRVMFECVMIKGLTDSLDDAATLSKFLQGLRVKVNLIPLNTAPEIPFDRSDDEAILHFQEVLVRNGTATFIRKNRGTTCPVPAVNSKRRCWLARREPHPFGFLFPIFFRSLSSLLLDISSPIDSKPT
jgi:23S rRNA (adenine2503-C2)-methyltransferase